MTRHMSDQRVRTRWAFIRLAVAGTLATVLPWWLALTIGRRHDVLVAASAFGLALIGIYSFPRLTNTTIRGAVILAATSLVLLSGVLALRDKLWWELAVGVVLFWVVSWLMPYRR